MPGRLFFSTQLLTFCLQNVEGKKINYIKIFARKIVFKVYKPKFHAFIKIILKTKQRVNFLIKLGKLGKLKQKRKQSFFYILRVLFPLLSTQIRLSSFCVSGELSIQRRQKHCIIHEIRKNRRQDFIEKEKKKFIINLLFFRILKV